MNLTHSPASYIKDVTIFIKKYHLEYATVLFEMKDENNDECFYTCHIYKTKNSIQLNFYNSFDEFEELIIGTTPRDTIDKFKESKYYKAKIIC